MGEYRGATRVLTPVSPVFLPGARNNGPISRDGRND